MRVILALLLSAAFWPVLAADQPITRSHAIAILSKPALPETFPHFPYVEPDAPKGGELALATVGTFDGFNPFILRGTAEGHVVGPWVILPGGSGAGSSVGHVWESLMVSSADEVAAGYGHLASRIELPADRMWVAFDIRPEARFSDGTPVTAEDVAWTFRTLLEKGRPSFRIQMAEVKDVVVENPQRVLFHFTNNENRELPLMVGGLPVLPKHFFADRDFAKPLTDAPVGSGPYRVANFELGRTVVYARRPDWWAVNHPTGKGTNNFDRVRFEYFRDSTVALEAFKAGQADLRSENVSKNWATAYEFPAVKDGLVVRKEFMHRLPNGLQGWAMNTRRKTFANPLVRQAMAEMFDFEWANKNLFYGAYTRTRSFFSNSDLASSGIPSAEEVKLLEPWRTSLPPALFTAPFTLPVTDGSGNNREQLRKALDLLREAGWQVKDRRLIDDDGKPVGFTILVDDPSIERIALPYSQMLSKLGMEVRVRSVDPAQYQRLTDDFDYDMLMIVYPQSDVPGTELRDYFGCESVKAQGSMNAAGICDPAVDALSRLVMTAEDRATMTTAARALDRVLLWRWYVVPNWGSNSFRIAWWDRFGRPDKPVREGVNFDTWWVDAAKAAANDAARRR